MKNLLFSAAFILTASLLKAQLPVTDVAANSQLASLNSQLATLNSQLGTLNSTSASSKLEQINTQKNTLETLNLGNKAESFLNKVSPYLKQGPEIKGILAQETNILKGIQSLNSFVSGKNLPGNLRSNIMQQAYSLMNPTGNYVDLALNVLTDNMYRMDDESRRSYLKEIRTSLDTILGQIAGLQSQAASYSTINSASNSYKQNFQKALQSIK